MHELVIVATFCFAWFEVTSSMMVDVPGYHGYVPELDRGVNEGMTSFAHGSPHSGFLLSERNRMRGTLLA